jgi:uncharacterized protein (TIGR02466 family)
MAEPIVYAIFPIPIYTVECDIDVSDALEFLEGSHALLPNEHAHNYGNKSEDDYILDTPVCKNLKQFALEHIEKFADNIMAWDFEGFQITQSWVSIKRPHEQHGIHYHPNSVVSAVFYFQDYNDNVSHVKFHRPEFMTQLMNQFAPATVTEKMYKTEFPWHYWSIPPKKNTLIIFPSWLQHSVSENVSSIPRKSLAINAVPTGKFGSRHSSAEIDFSRLK